MRRPRTSVEIDTAVSGAIEMLEQASSPVTTTLTDFARLVRRAYKQLEQVSAEEAKTSPSHARLEAAMAAASAALDAIVFPTRGSSR